jgi:hypothetical protein
MYASEGTFIPCTLQTQYESTKFYLYYIRELQLFIYNDLYIFIAYSVIKKLAFTTKYLVFLQIKSVKLNVSRNKMVYANYIFFISTAVGAGVAHSVEFNYRMDDWVIEVQSLAEAKGLFL